MVFKVGYMDCLVNNQVIPSASVRVHVSQYSRHGLVSGGSEGLIVPKDIHRSVEIIYNQSAITNNTCVGMRVKL